MNQNIPAYQTGWASEDEFNDARPNNNGRFADVRVLRHGLTSTYNAGTVRVDHRMTSGLTFLSHYTYSKTTTDRYQLDSAIDDLTQPSWDWNRQLGRGEARFSHPHRFVAAATWDVPFGDSLKGIAREAPVRLARLRRLHAESGDALTVFNTQSSARDFEPEMPNVIGDPNDGPRTTQEYFNTAAFADPGQDVKGNARPGIVRGPGINNLDLSLGKTFGDPEHEAAVPRRSLQRAEPRAVAIPGHRLQHRRRQHVRPRDGRARRADRAAQPEADVLDELTCVVPSTPASDAQLRESVLHRWQAHRDGRWGSLVRWAEPRPT